MTMTRIPFLLFLIAWVALAPAMAEPVYSPRPSENERAQILNVLRPSSDSQVRFIVHDLRVIKGQKARYAYAVIEPSKQEYDGGEFLLKYAGGWRVIWSVTGGGTDDCRTAAVYYQSALRLLESEGIDPDVVSPKLHEEYLRLATLAAEDPGCTALGDLGPELSAFAPEADCTKCNADDPKPVAARNHPRIMPDSRLPAPNTGADLDGDGKPEVVSVVHILPESAGRSIEENVVIANPWDSDASAQDLPDEDTQMALLITNSRTKARYLLHSPYVELSANLLSGAPFEAKRAKTPQGLAFRKDCPALRHDFLQMATEAGIDIALFWNLSRYEVCWPEEIP